QALPFLVLGVLVSGAITALVSPAVLERLLPRSALLAVPSAALAGTALPGCECASVPVAGRLAARGVQPAAAVAFMLAAPAVNPIVLVATAVAFPGQPQMVLARFLGSLLTSIAVGLVWWRVGGDAWVERVRSRVAGASDPRWPAFSSAARHDLWDAGGWLVVGAAAAATLQVLVPRSLLLAVADHPALSVLVMGGLAVLLAICSEADAFVAASLREFSLTARLVFLVVGPAVDVKLIAMQSGVFGRRFAARFAPLTFGVAVACALVVGQVVLR
ncbi:MAG TPA: permease, partial [Actinomycetota bacterium]|nr:permease [Actinomycetota bacterium]